MPTLTCPHCSEPVEVAVSRAGAEVPCPACRQLVQVPKLGRLRELENAAGPTTPQASSGGPLVGRRVAFASLLAIAAFAAAIAAFCLIRYATIETPYTSQEHIAEIDQMYPELPPAQLVREWQQIEQFHPDISGPHRYKIVANEKASWLRQGLIALTVAAIAALIATLLVWLPKRR
jgi:hypothetical protein